MRWSEQSVNILCLQTSMSEVLKTTKKPIFQSVFSLETWLTWCCGSGVNVWAGVGIWPACTLVGIQLVPCCCSATLAKTCWLGCVSTAPASRAWPWSPLSCTGRRMRAWSTAATTVATAPALVPPSAWRQNSKLKLAVTSTTWSFCFEPSSPLILSFWKESETQVSFSRTKSCCEHLLVFDRFGLDRDFRQTKAPRWQWKCWWRFLSRV